MCVKVCEGVSVRVWVCARVCVYVYVRVQGCGCVRGGVCEGARMSQCVRM